MAARTWSIALRCLHRRVAAASRCPRRSPWLRQGPAVQFALPQGRGMLLRYVSGYVPKFSASFTTEWLADACSDCAVARRVLTDYHPLEPEMTLQLAMQWFPQCFAGSTLQRFRVPVPWEGDLPERVQQYMNSTWRAVDTPLADFLRVRNDSPGLAEEVGTRTLPARSHIDEEGPPRCCGPMI